MVVKMNCPTLTSGILRRSALLLPLRQCSFGDVFEIFLRDPELETYAELYFAPNGKRLQLL
jgi:hypothetical protein